MKTTTKPQCSEEGCDREAKHRGYCPRHYNKHRKDGSLPLLPPPASAGDLTGQKFGKLTAVRPAGLIKTIRHWHCLCDCGRETVTTAWILLNRPNPSCMRKGCCSNTESLVEQTFGNWRVEDRAGSNSTNHATWNCKCIRCGVEAVLSAKNLKRQGGLACKNVECRTATRAELPPDKTQTCKRCKRTLPFAPENFYTDRATVRGRLRVCHDCRRQRTREWAYRVRMQVFTHYCKGTPCCACCKETHLEFLTIDHIDGNGAEHRRNLNTSSICRWLIKNNYPEGFRVLCMNCNFCLGVFGYCAHDPFNMRQPITPRGKRRSVGTRKAVSNHGHVGVP